MTGVQTCALPIFERVFLLKRYSSIKEVNISEIYFENVSHLMERRLEDEKQSEEYVEKNVKDQKLDATFSDIKTENKAAFFESLKVFQNNNPNFLSSIINRELASKFWSI